MTRIYIDQALDENTLLELPDAAARHLISVLRKQPGDQISLFNGTGVEATATIATASKRHASVNITGCQKVDRESPVNITLLQCISKGDRMDFAVQKATELGVNTIVPVISERSVVRVSSERWEKKQNHWQGVAIAACEQSGRTIIPKVSEVRDIAKALADVQDQSALKLIFHTAKSDKNKNFGPVNSVYLLIGPEGGFSDSEVGLAREFGFQEISLGNRVLRTETAAIAALTAVQMRFGDFTNAL